MKIRIWCRPVSYGDGSAGVRLFKTEAEAETDGETDDERFCDDVSCKIIDTDDFEVLHA